MPAEAPARWERLKSLFPDLAEGDPADRSARLSAVCGDDPDLRAELETLLAADRDADRVLSALLGAAAEPEAEAVLPAGTRCGRFTVIDLIARGGMGAVYRARDEALGREVALKLVEGAVPGAAARRRFEVETRLLARLSHPGIARILDVGILEHAPGLAAACPFFAMELVQGVPITEHARVRGLGIPERLELLAQVCDAVEHAHQRGIIHRDLKPANILVDEGGRPRVLDFGVARATDSDIRATISADGPRIVGTLPYMSPEQVAGDAGDLDTRSDVYALGVVGYELLTGSLPHDRPATLLEAIRTIQEQEPRRPSRLDRGLAGDPETILLTALAKDRARRYQSAGAMAADLRRALRREPLTAHPPTSLYLLTTFARRHRTAVALAGVAALAILAGSAAAAWQAYRATRAEASALALNDANVRTIADLLEVYDAVLYLSGSMEVRRMVSDLALANVNVILENKLSDPSIRRRAARIYYNYARVLGGNTLPSAGDVGSATALFKKASALYAELLAESPPDPVLLYDAMVVRRDHGDVRVEYLGDHAGAAEQFATGRDLAAARTGFQPEDMEAWYWLAAMSRRAAEAHAAAGRAEEARAEAEQLSRALDRFAPLARDNPGAPKWAAETWRELARTLRAAGDHEAALAAAGRAGSLYEQAIDREPQNHDLAGGLGGVHVTIAEIAQARGDTAAAAERYKRAAELFGSVYWRDQSNMLAAERTATCLADHASALCTLGRPLEAVGIGREAVRIAAGVAEANPTSFPQQVRLAEGCLTLGRAMLDIAQGPAGRIGDPPEIWVEAHGMFARGLAALAGWTGAEASPVSATRRELRAGLDRCRPVLDAAAASPRSAPTENSGLPSVP